MSGFDEVKSLDLTNHRRFLKVIGRVLGHAATLEGAEEQAFLKDLLTIVAEQDEDVAAQVGQSVG